MLIKSTVEEKVEMREGMDVKQFAPGQSRSENSFDKTLSSGLKVDRRQLLNRCGGKWKSHLCFTFSGQAEALCI